MKETCTYEHISHYKCTEFLEGNIKERDHLEDVRVDGMIILIWILNERSLSMLIDVN
jgi:hypothetical protein